jgi:hypothetical protein
MPSGSSSADMRGLYSKMLDNGARYRGPPLGGLLECRQIAVERPNHPSSRPP